jgi:signal transduction histidine kinase
MTRVLNSTLEATWYRLGIRARLTVLYGGMFLLAGAALIGIFYLLFRNNYPGGQDVAGLLGHPKEIRPGEVITFRSGAKLTLPDVRSIGARLDAHRSRVLDRLLRQCLVALALVALAAGVLGWWMAGRALRPVRRITATARRVAGRNLHERIALTGPADEIKELADTIDAMLGRLDAAFTSQRQFVAHASHELRTPLATNRTLLEVAAGGQPLTPEVRRMVDTVLATNARSERIIDGLLTLARSDGQAVAHRPVDLSDVAAEAVEQTAAEAASARVTVDATPDPAVTTGDPVLLERLALNLVRNGIRHNHPGGWVTVRTSPAGTGWTELMVANSGPVVPADRIDELFEPFQRMDRGGDERGVGLGLSIVRSVVDSHGGSLTAEPHTGGGLTFRVRLPAARV